MSTHRSQVGKHTGDTNTEGSEEELPIREDLGSVLAACAKSRFRSTGGYSATFSPAARIGVGRCSRTISSCRQSGRHPKARLVRLEPRFLLGGELLLDLEADSIRIHLVRNGCVVEDLRCIPSHGRMENGYLYQQTTEGAFLGTAEVGGKQLPDGVAVLRFLDVVLPGDSCQTIFIQQRCQPLHHEKQVAFHQPHRNGRGDGGKDADAGGIGNRSFLALLLLLGLPLGIICDLLWALLGMMHRTVSLRANLADFALVDTLRPDGFCGVFAGFELRADSLFFGRGLLWPDFGVLVARQRRTAFLLLAVGRADLHELGFRRNGLGNMGIDLRVVAVWVGASVLPYVRKQ
jgi:hypothetical protein